MRGKITFLTAIGVLLLAASLTIRFLDRPRDVEPVEQTDDSYVSEFFGVGLDVGDFEGLGCSSFCPTSLILEYDNADPGLVVGKFLGTLEGKQGGTRPAEIYLVTPAGAENLALAEETESNITLAVEAVTAPSAENTSGAGGSNQMAVVTVPEIDNAAFFGVTFSWRPGKALTDAGIGKKNLRVAYATSHPALAGKEGAYSLDIADPEDSLKDVGIKVVAAGIRIGAASPEPDGRPDPRSVLWRVGTGESEAYYVVTLERPTLRFWINLINEQTLFIAGLLLGAVVGAVASDWFTRRS